MPISTITVSQIETFLASKNFCPAARKGSLGRISSLFEFATRRRWVPANICREIETPILDWKAPRILTPEQVELLMRTCQDRWPNRAAYLALCLFVGLRPTEARQITWNEIGQGTVRIEANITKIRQRRIVNMEPAAIAWLAWAREHGAKLPLSESLRQLWNKDFRKVIGERRWPQDAFRHTCASYWLTQRQDAGYVSMQLGNSPNILFRHYRELATKEQAERFWGILPCK